MDSRDTETCNSVMAVLYKGLPADGVACVSASVEVPGKQRTLRSCVGTVQPLRTPKKRSSINLFRNARQEVLQRISLQHPSRALYSSHPSIFIKGQLCGIVDQTELILSGNHSCLMGGTPINLSDIPGLIEDPIICHYGPWAFLKMVKEQSIVQMYTIAQLPRRE